MEPWPPALCDAQEEWNRAVLEGLYAGLCTRRRVQWDTTEGTDDEDATATLSVAEEEAEPPPPASSTGPPGPRRPPWGAPSLAGSSAASPDG